MPSAYVVLRVSNLVFATGYTVSPIVLQDVGPATLAMTRLAIGALIRVSWAWPRMVEAKVSRGGSWRTTRQQRGAPDYHRARLADPPLAAHKFVLANLPCTMPTMTSQW